MKPRIIVIGSTGKLGVKLLNYCLKFKIEIFCITGFQNFKLLNKQSINLKTKNSFALSKQSDQKKFVALLKKYKVDLIYFLDYGYYSIFYANIFLQNNLNSKIAIANKEMIIAGGNTLITNIRKTKNTLIPLDSEHFSLLNSDTKSKNLNKIYITASGGPFYFKKKVNLNNVNLKNVLRHPKWKMGINNSIDSSNFINKILEIYEVSIIYEVDIKKIDFLISREAYIHSIVVSNDNTVNINCFENNMIIPLLKPLRHFYPDIFIHNKSIFLKSKMLKLEKFRDNRFKINKYLNVFKGLNAHKQISFMILNNIAHKKYLKGEIKYNDIIDFIMSKLNNINSMVNLNSINNRIKFIKLIEKKYDITN